MGWQSLFMMGSLAVAGISTACFFLLAYLYLTNERRQRARIQRAQADMADITALFRTMRDIVNQQKELARNFNDGLDQKMTVVKDVLAKGLERNERLYERQRELNQAMDQLRARLDSLQREAHSVSAGSTSNPGIRSAPRPSSAAQPPKVVGSPRPVKELTPKIRSDELEGTGLTRAEYREWQGTDLDAQGRAAPDQALPPPGQLPPTAPETPAAADAARQLEMLLAEATAAPETPDDPAAARAAFRSLLNLGADTAPHSDPLAEIPAPNAGNNGASGPAPLQERVLEYNEAGMSVAEIARELGIGKGEVRLMLSLARQKRR